MREGFCLCTYAYLCDASRINRFGVIGRTLLKEEIEFLRAGADLFCRFSTKKEVTTMCGDGRAARMFFARYATIGGRTAARIPSWG